MKSSHGSFHVITYNPNKNRKEKVKDVSITPSSWRKRFDLLLA
jgi:hypothetical protein